MDSSIILFSVVAGAILLSVITFVMTGTIIAPIIVILVISMIIYALYAAGYVTVAVNEYGGVEIDYHENIPAPSSSGKSEPKNIEISEVFYIGGNDYTYDEASAVCAAYNAQLASYDQIAAAFAAGAEWCSYGWSQGGMALFPTQPSTWADLQKDAVARTNCGRPGVNGGYFDPSTKFGVNCYGVKPKNKNTKFPMPLPGTDSSAFNKMVNKFKSMLDHMPVNPFNRVGWSEWNAKSHESSEVSSAINEVQNYI